METIDFNEVIKQNIGVVEGLMYPDGVQRIDVRRNMPDSIHSLDELGNYIGYCPNPLSPTGYGGIILSFETRTYSCVQVLFPYRYSTLIYVRRSNAENGAWNEWHEAKLNKLIF